LGVHEQQHVVSWLKHWQAEDCKEPRKVVVFEEHCARSIVGRLHWNSRHQTALWNENENQKQSAAIIYYYYYYLYYLLLFHSSHWLQGIIHFGPLVQWAAIISIISIIAIIFYYLLLFYYYFTIIYYYFLLARGYTFKKCIPLRVSY